MEIGDKLKKLIENKGITAYMLADYTGVSQATISRILNKNSKPNASTLKSITEYFKVDPEYLLSSSYHIAKNEVRELDREGYSNDGLMHVPLVSEYAYGGYLQGFNDPEYIDELPKIPFIVEKEHKGEYMCFEVKGDSMDDGSHESYLERDILLCRNVRKDFWKSKLHINKWDFVIVHKDSGICLKRIVKHDVERGLITLHSLNDYYEDFEMDLRDVTKIFNVVDIQRKRNRR